VEGIGEGDGGVLQGRGHGLMHFSSSGSSGRYWTALSLVVRACDLNRDRRAQCDVEFP